MPYKNAVLDDKELQANLKAINPKFGELCVRVCGDVWGLPLIDQKTKALISIAVDVVNQDHVGPGSPFGAHVDMALKHEPPGTRLKKCFCSCVPTPASIKQPDALAP